jgi:hypothetical protein
MTNARRKLLLNAFRLFDSGLMIFAFMVATLAVLHQSHTVTITEFFSIRVRIQNFAIFSLLVFAWHLIFSVSGLYVSRRLSSRRGEVVDICDPPRRDRFPHCISDGRIPGTILAGEHVHDYGQPTSAPGHACSDAKA